MKELTGIELIGVILLACILIVAAFMEVYKKKFRKDKASDAEIYSVALAMSLILTLASYFGFHLDGSLWAIPIYFIFVYTAQFYCSMKIIKSIVKHIAKKKGVTLDGFEYNE